MPKARIFAREGGQKDRALAGPGSADRRHQAAGTPYSSFFKNLCLSVSNLWLLHFPALYCQFHGVEDFFGVVLVEDGHAEDGGFDEAVDEFVHVFDDEAFELAGADAADDDGAHEVAHFDDSAADSFVRVYAGFSELDQVAEEYAEKLFIGGALFDNFVQDFNQGFFCREICILCDFKKDYFQFGKQFFYAT